LAIFRKRVLGKKILGVARRGKNILIELSGHSLVLIHQKMTGHLLLGSWSPSPKASDDHRKLEVGRWMPEGKSREMNDPKNGFIRLIFFLDGPKGQNMLALSDMRRFAKVLCGSKEEILDLPELKGLGPEALEVSYKDFLGLFKNKKGKIKQVLMDQKFLVGIGNIYSDEILCVAKIQPLSRVEKLKETHIKALYRAMKNILKKGILMRGTSTDDFRDTYGRKGNYMKAILVYQRTGKKCKKGHTIQRLKLGGRSAHFCPVCQKLIG
jgi:formamidopyrimidine-DNA glycosylase